MSPAQQAPIIKWKQYVQERSKPAINGLSHLRGSVALRCGVFSIPLSWRMPGKELKHVGGKRKNKKTLPMNRDADWSLSCKTPPEHTLLYFQQLAASSQQPSVVAPDHWTTWIQSQPLRDKLWQQTAQDSHALFITHGKGPFGNEHQWNQWSVLRHTGKDRSHLHIPSPRLWRPLTLAPGVPLGVNYRDPLSGYHTTIPTCRTDAGRAIWQLLNVLLHIWTPWTHPVQQWSLPRGHECQHLALMWYFMPSITHRQ